MRIKQQKPTIDLVALKKEIVEIHTEGQKTLSHLKRLLKDYDDYQDRFYELEKKLQGVETEHGIGVEQILAVDALEDALNV